jgi:hypothetical protein
MLIDHATAVGLDGEYGHSKCVATPPHTELTPPR